MYVNGTSAGMTYPTTTSWQTTVSLILGSNTLSIYGKDAAGNQTGTTTTSILRHKLSDINGDGVIDLTDLSLFGADWQKTAGSLANPLSDMNNDGVVDLTDFSIFAKQYGQ